MSDEMKDQMPAPTEPVAAPTPTPAPTTSSSDPSRMWKIASGLLLIALVISVVRPGAAGATKAISSADAAGKFLEVVNKVYADAGVTNAKLTEVNEDHGLYLVKFTADLNGENTPQEAYLSRDGELIVPRVVPIADLLTEFEAKQTAPAEGTVPADGEVAPADGENVEVK